MVQIGVIEMNADTGYGYQVDVEMTGTAGSARTCAHCEANAQAVSNHRPGRRVGSIQPKRTRPSRRF